VGVDPALPAAFIAKGKKGDDNLVASCQSYVDLSGINETRRLCSNFACREKGIKRTIMLQRGRVILKKSLISFCGARRIN